MIFKNATKLPTGRQRRADIERTGFKYGWEYDGPDRQQFRYVYDLLYEHLYRELYEDLAIDICDGLGIEPPNKHLFERKTLEDWKYPGPAADLVVSVNTEAYEDLYSDIKRDLVADMHQSLRQMSDATKKNESESN